MMSHSIRVLAQALTLLGILVAAAPVGATDRNGGDDCSLFPHVDWGDAPEGVLAYPGVIGKFPTCRQMNVVGDQTVPAGCAPASTFPGVTGHIFNRPSESGPQYWIGCYSDPLGRPSGFDGEDEGLMNQPAQGSSFCSTSQHPDCAENAYGLSFDQDECTADGSDAGVTSSLEFATCQSGSVTFTTWSCAAAPRNVVLNIAIDWNHDGDWNDVVLCGGGACAYEWAVKNVNITLPPGCGTITSPTFLNGSTAGPAWLRLTISDTPVTNDYPWAGTAGESGTEGGETEDYPAMVQQAVPAQPSSWGNVKGTYR
jgi:hypothetical protein